jgi:predicted ABC-type ATPase
MPDLYILTGSNGAGKSTTGRFYLPAEIRNNHVIFDGDKLFMQKRNNVYKIETPSIKEASRIALEWLAREFECRVNDAIASKNDFVYEGHFPEDENWGTPKRFKAAGYQINLIFLGLANTKLSEQRVLYRAKKGGHNVPPYEIERNFYGNLRQLDKNYSIIDKLQIIDTSGSTSPKVIAIFSNGKVNDALPVKEIPEWFENGLPSLFQIVFIKQNQIGFE